MYPLANGYAYTLATAYVDIKGSRFLGIGSIKWSEVMEGREQVPGASLFTVAETPGMYKATVEFEMLLSEFERMNRLLKATGYMLTRFNMMAHCSDPAGVLPLLTIAYPNLGINDGSGSLEHKASMMSIKTTVGPQAAISYNGVTAVGAKLLATGAGNAFGGSAVVASASASLGLSL